MGFSLSHSLTKAKFPVVGAAGPTTKPSEREKSRKIPSFGKGKSKTADQLLCEYSQYTLEHWDEVELDEADLEDAELGGDNAVPRCLSESVFLMGCKKDDLGRKDDIVENTRGPRPRYDLRLKGTKVRRSGGVLGSSRSEEVELQKSKKEIAKWASEVGTAKSEVLFDADSPTEADEQPAPVVLLSPEAIAGQFTWLCAQDADAFEPSQSFLGMRSPSQTMLGFGERILAIGELRPYMTPVEDLHRVLDDVLLESSHDEVNETALEFVPARRAPRHLIAKNGGENPFEGDFLMEKDEGVAEISSEHASHQMKVGEEHVEWVCEASARSNAKIGMETVDLGLCAKCVPNSDFLPGIDHLTNIAVRSMWFEYDRNTQLEPAAQPLETRPLSISELLDWYYEVGGSTGSEVENCSSPQTFFDDETDDEEEKEDFCKPQKLSFYDAVAQEEVGYTAFNQLLEPLEVDLLPRIHRAEDDFDMNEAS